MTRAFVLAVLIVIGGAARDIQAAEPGTGCQAARAALIATG